MHPQNNALTEARGLAFMLASVLLFSVNTLVVRAVSLHFPAVDGWLASLFRGAIGIVVVAALHGWGRGLQPKRLFASRLVIIRGVVGGIATIAFYITIVKLGSARAVIINLTYPVFASIIAALWLKERLSRNAVIWMLIGLCGLAIFLSDDGNLMHPSSYDLLAIFGAITAGWVVVVIRRLRNEEHPATIFAAQTLFIFVLSSPAATKLPQLSGTVWIGLTAAAAIVAIAQLFMTKAYQAMTVSKGSSIQMLLPILTGIGGFLCFGESFHPVELLGAGLTLFATWRVTASR
jgi:drug/metabolite transporter (DMT)-like permease